MNLTGRLCLLALLASAASILTPGAFAPTALALPQERNPYIGYVFPAGGRQGTTFEAKIGGQFIRGIQNVFVTGAGVTATITRYEGPNGPLTRQQQQELRRRVQEIVQARLPNRAARSAVQKTDTQPPRVIPLPDLPDLQHLELLNGRQLRKIVEKYANPDKRTKPPIAETAFLQVSIDGGATPGDREIRLLTAAGLSNALVFQVGQLPEASDRDADDAAEAPTAPLNLPIALNGQIMPGEVDRFRLAARKGQHLVLQLEARHLIPYIADAVPGWFQGLISLHDPAGNEIAFADHYRSDQDPVLFCDIPSDGVYTLDVRDSIYRGREDFVYRCTVGEEPFITQIFPLGGRLAAPTTVSAIGWNLPFDKVTLDTKPGGEPLRDSAWLCKLEDSNRLPYAVDDLPEAAEVEPNDTIKQPQKVTLPVIINGRISKPGDVDVFRFDAKAGDQVVAEVNARRLGSPLDSLLRLMDSSGKVLAWNDDTEDKSMGLLTHSADSYISFKIPAAGTYFVQLSDAQHHGGEEYAYRLRLSPPRPDFALRVTPSTINEGNGRPAILTAYAFRKDGFDGDIDLALKGAPDGFLLSGGRIPAGRDKVRLTLTAPPQRIDDPVALQMEGHAQVDGVTVTHEAFPADNMMQAFAYMHLVPKRVFIVDVMGAGRKAPGATVDGAPIRVPAGGSAPVKLLIPALPASLKNVQLEIDDPPAGLTLSDAASAPGVVTFILKAKPDAPKVGYADNLILEIFSDVGGNRASLGILPAVSFQIVKP
jgi:hypothetical protein